MELWYGLVPSSLSESDPLLPPFAISRYCEINMFVETRSTKKRSSQSLISCSPISSICAYVLKPPTRRFVCAWRFLMLPSWFWKASGSVGSASRSSLKDVTYICRTCAIERLCCHSGSDSSILIRWAYRTGSSSCSINASSPAFFVESRMLFSVIGRGSRRANVVISASRSWSSLAWVRTTSPELDAHREDLHCQGATVQGPPRKAGHGVPRPRW
mmetsp:Transcript_44714/g.127616  ORF Transcript_44714/g.127616 Transcript_44714/m.127616 type:complete len:215 (-) Transcript_44714:187-831(-)